MQHRNREKQRASQEYQAHYARKPQIKTRNIPSGDANSVTEKIPMAWGTTIDSLTPEINISQYAIETRYLTLRDIEPYLVLDS